MTPLKKMTIKTCGDFSPSKLRAKLLALGPTQTDPDGTTKKVMPPDGTPLPIIKIAGEASSAETGSTPLGAYTLLIGQFIGTDLTTGELYSSKKCILPDYIGSELGAALLNAGVEGQSVNFAFEIICKQKASSVTGYEYGIRSLMNIEPTDTAKRLMALAGIVAPTKQLELSNVDPVAQAATLAAADAAAAEAAAKAEAEAKANAEAEAKAKAAKTAKK